MNVGMVMACKGYERKKCVHGGKKRLKEQYFSATIRKFRSSNSQ